MLFQVVHNAEVCGYIVLIMTCAYHGKHTQGQHMHAQHMHDIAEIATTKCQTMQYVSTCCEQSNTLKNLAKLEKLGKFEKQKPKNEKT